MHLGIGAVEVQNISQFYPSPLFGNIINIIKRAITALTNKRHDRQELLRNIQQAAHYLPFKIIDNCRAYLVAADLASLSLASPPQLPSHCRNLSVPTFII